MKWVSGPRLATHQQKGGEGEPLDHIDLAYVPCTSTYCQWCYTHDLNQLEAHESFGMVSHHGLVFNTKYFYTYTEIKEKP